MTSAAAQLAMWVPTDGVLHLTSDITCLNIESSSTGLCSTTAIDQVGADSGINCIFVGTDGWWGFQLGGSPWLSVSPPQVITGVMCVEG